MHKFGPRMSSIEIFYFFVLGSTVSVNICKLAKPFVQQVVLGLKVITGSDLRRLHTEAQVYLRWLLYIGHALNGNVELQPDAWAEEVNPGLNMLNMITH